MLSNELRWYGRILPKELTELSIIVISDLHYGNPYCSLKHFSRTINFIRENDNCYCFLNGDLCESITKASKGDIYTQTLTPQQQRDDVISMLLPLKDKILGVCTGNHEQRIYKETGIDLTKDIAESLGIPYRAEGMLFKISFGDGNSNVKGKPFVFWGYITHGYGGARTKSAKAVKAERLSTWIHADFYCLHPHTKILYGDLKWNELGNVKLGDELIGISEYPEFNQTRKVLHTKVTDVKNRFSNTLKIILEDDTNIITTPDHLWLNKKRHDGAKLGGRYNWYRADTLSIGDELLQVFPKWEIKDNWVNGYIAGMLDGEGSITIGNRRERQMTFSQKEGLVMDFFENYLKEHNIGYRKYTRPDGCSQLIMTIDASRLIGMTHPIRLREKARNLVEKRLHKPKTLKIAEIIPLGRQEVVAIETGAHTFLAEGIATHNCMSHDHVVNVAPDIYLMPDNRGYLDSDGFLSGKVTAHREMLIKTNAFLKWGGYAESGGFPPSDLSTPIINLLTPISKQWELYPEKPQQAVKVSV